MIRDKIIKRLGGYTHLPDGREALAEIVKDHFNGVSEDEIMRKETVVVKDANGRPKQKEAWYHRGKKMDDGTVEMLKREATEFLNSSFYLHLKNELAYHAERQLMINKATHPDHIIEAKMLAYLSDVIQDRTKKFASIKK